MFRLARPSMAVNDPRVSKGTAKRRYQMWNTWDISETEKRSKIINWVASVARGAPGGKLKHLVLSCHGLPGYLQLGEGINSKHLPLFAGWRGLIGKIWFPNCLVAKIPTKAEQTKLNRDYPGWGTSDGNVFCSSLAKIVQCHIVASTEIQCERVRDVPRDMMTSFEGLILSYGPNGSVTWSARNLSTYDKAGVCVAVPD